MGTFIIPCLSMRKLKIQWRYCVHTLWRNRDILNETGSNEDRVKTDRFLDEMEEFYLLHEQEARGREGGEGTENRTNVISALRYLALYINLLPTAYHGPFRKVVFLSFTKRENIRGFEKLHCLPKLHSYKLNLVYHILILCLCSVTSQSSYWW